MNSYMMRLQAETTALINRRSRHAWLMLKRRGMITCCVFIEMDRKRVAMQGVVELEISLGRSPCEE